MDTSIRLYNSNSRLHSILDAKQPGRPTTPLLHEEDSLTETASVDEEERATDTISRQSAKLRCRRLAVAAYCTATLYQQRAANFRRWP